MKKMFRMQSGFTLIELLIVVAIIGILSAVVLTNLGPARDKAKDGKIKSELSNMRAQAELYAGANSDTYGTAYAVATCPTATAANLFGTAGSASGLFDLIVSAKKSIPTTGVMTCASSATAWAVSATLNKPSTGMTSFCVDSNGSSKEVASAITTTVCP